MYTQQAEAAGAGDTGTEAGASSDGGAPAVDDDVVDAEIVDEDTGKK